MNVSLISSALNFLQHLVGHSTTVLTNTFIIGICVSASLPRELAAQGQGPILTASKFPGPSMIKVGQMKK